MVAPVQTRDCSGARDIDIPCARGNKYILNSNQFFDIYVFALNSNSIAKKSFTYVYSYLLQLIQNRWCSEMFTYVCIEFIIQVSKQKNARVFVLLGWYKTDKTPREPSGA